MLLLLSFLQQAEIIRAYWSVTLYIYMYIYKLKIIVKKQNKSG